jgi:hypothetical protein
MPIAMIITSVKPEGTSFFNEAHPEHTAETQAEYDWIASLPGFVTFTKEFPDANTSIRTLVWDTPENYANFLGLREDRPHFTKRNEYNAVTGITFAMTETVI